MTIKNLFDSELLFWIDANIDFLGVNPINEKEDFNVIQRKIDEDCEKYWNTDNPCKLAVNLNSGVLNTEIEKQEPNSYKLKLNFHSMCIDIYGKYGDKLYKIGAMPTPSNDLCWIINKTHYVTRVTAIKDYYGCVGKIDFETVRGEGWKYNIRDDEFVCSINKLEYQFDPTVEEIFNNHLSYRSKLLLAASIETELTIDNFKLALRKLPIFKPDSLYNYKFSRLEYFEDAVLNSRKYAQPTKGILLGINTIIASKAKQYTTSGEKLEGCLVRSESKIYALENFRTCCNIYNGGESGYQPAFTYSDTLGFFDVFKTVTSRSAGRQRLLIDNIVIKKGMLWVVEKDGSMKNMYEFLSMPQSARLSCLSESPFCNNDKPKRIMMNAKLSSQAVPLKNELDDITHRIDARVGFTDIEGYSAADSIICSKSYKKKLDTFEETILYLNKKSNAYALIVNNDTYPVSILKLLFPSKNEAVLENYSDVKVDRIDDVDQNNVRVFLSWTIEFRPGDKITNLHGAKGTVGLILDDDKMPRLLNKVGNMEPGPLDIIIPGYSTMRRGSLGQIVEGWQRACGIELDAESLYLSKVMEKYIDQMKDFSEKSLVQYNGITTTIPVGLNQIMRLYHHASTHVSCASAYGKGKRTLKLGEMEKLNLVANDCPNILRELGIRSITKYVGAHKMIAEMEETGQLPEATHLSMQFIEIMKSMGYEVIVEDDDNNKISINDNNITAVMHELDVQNFNSVIKNKEVIANEDNC